MDLEEVLQLRWYYQIELEPGRSTPGRPIGTLPTVRRVIDAIDFAGARVLDIGAQEFAAPILIESKGPAQVVAYDRLSLTSQFDIIRQVYGLDNTEYVHGLTLHELKNALVSRGIEVPFDVVLLTGVLYHMVDPLMGLALSRSMLRSGGLMVIETSVAAREGLFADCNHRGSLYKGSNYFQISPQVLDYWCRMLRLKPVDVFWQEGEEIRRMFLIAEATDEVVAEDEDEWIRKGFIWKDFEPYGLRYRELRSQKPPVTYRPLDGLASRSYVDVEPYYLDVWRTLQSRRALKFDPSSAVITLADKKEA